MITIVPYDLRWPDEFQALARPIRQSLGDVPLRIDHIGSTAVPGLAAKDKIDIQITIADFSNLQHILDSLQSLGLVLVESITHDHIPPHSTGSELDWEKRVLHEAPGARPANIHIRKAGRPNQRYPILFRDYLRAHPVAMESYALIKMQLAHYAEPMSSPDDQEFYYDIKDPACDLIMAGAEEWVQRTNWTMGPTDA